ncbi:lipopolysaccharide biosynthesis protein [Pseudonocardia sp.]|uniref:lipopolysaccharide biosynthesis protein n=1 Tax=Pseudonocardia sp. TaxID=60912 RepID=UPI003D13A9B3
MARPAATRSRSGSLPSAVHLGAGLAVLGGAGYAFVAIVGHTFDTPTEASALSALISLYLLINIVGPGVYAGLEQATSRAISAAAARGEPMRPTARRSGSLAARSFAVLAAVLVVAWPLGLDDVLDGRTSLLAALLVAVAGSAAVYWTRGVLGGRQRFHAYARTLYVEGAARLLACLALLGLATFFAVAGPGAFGMAFALGSAVAALSVVRAVRIDEPPGGAQPEQLGRSFAYLTVAIALSQLLANIGPVVVSYRLGADAVTAAVFGAAFVLARIPLFLVSPVQALLLPKLTRAAATGDGAAVARLQGQVLAAGAAVGGLGVLACFWLGPWLTEVLFAAPRRPDAVAVGLLALATALMTAALVLQTTLVALGRQRLVTVAWVVGTLVHLVVLVAPGAPVGAAIAAQLAGPGTVLVVLGAGVARALRPAGRPA